MSHPCQYSPEVIERLAGLIQRDERVHDPFAGTGVRLGFLCDDLGAHYTGTDIEDWQDRSARVRIGNSRDPGTYPASPFTVVTSPVYQNKRLCDYPEGPLPTTKTKGRRDYGIGLGRALHPDNLARHTGRPSRAEAYWRLHDECVKHWDERVILNVDLPIAARWADLLRSHGYEIWNNWAVYTQRDRGQQHTAGYADFEVVIEARRP